MIFFYKKYSLIYEIISCSTLTHEFINIFYKLYELILIFCIYSLQGHLYCKECIYENILAQKKEIKKSKKHFEEQQKELVVC